MPNPEQTDWERVVREIAARVDPAATGGSESWGIVCRDGSRSLLTASPTRKTPTIEVLGRQAGASCEDILHDAEVVAAEGLRGSKKLAPLADGAGGSLPVSARPAKGPSAPGRSTIAMPAATPSLSLESGAKSPPCGGPEFGVSITMPRPTASVAMSRGKLDPQLTRVIDAWPALSLRTRQAVLAMIDAALDKR